MIPLWPCPFCGGKAEIGGDNHGDRDVHCTKCWAGIWDTHLEEAIAGWNRRVTVEKSSEGSVSYLNK